MANRVITWAFKFSGIKPTEKFVLVAMADQANNEGTLFPAVNTLGTDCCLSRRQCQYIIKRLETYGLITVTRFRSRANGTYTSNLFQCHVDIDPATWKPPQSNERRHPGLADLKPFFAHLQKQFEDGDRLQHFKTWLVALHPVSIERGNRLIIRVPSDLHITMVKEKFATEVLASARAAIDPKISRFHMISNQRKLDLSASGPV